jgi:hypothetical protein
MKALRFFETMGTALLANERHISDDLETYFGDCFSRYFNTIRLKETDTRLMSYTEMPNNE